MASNASMHQFDQTYFIQELKNANVIKNDDQRTLTKIKFITTGLVLAAKSCGLYNDQEILKWIRRGKKISPEQQATWVKMGRDLSMLFLEQFEKYQELSTYLKNELPVEEAEEWKSILSSQEYVWPSGKGEGWNNVFNPVPSLCEKVSIEAKSAPELNKRKLEDEDTNSKRQKTQSISEGTSQVDHPISKPENDSSNEMEDKTEDTENSSPESEGKTQMDDLRSSPENDLNDKNDEEKSVTDSSSSDEQLVSEDTRQLNDSRSLDEKYSDDEEEDKIKKTKSQSPEPELVLEDKSQIDDSKSVPKSNVSNIKEDEKRGTEKSSSDLENDEKRGSKQSSIDVQLVSEDTSQIDDSNSEEARNSSNEHEDSSFEERMSKTKDNTDKSDLEIKTDEVKSAEISNIKSREKKYSTTKISDLIEIEKDEKEAAGMNIEYSKSISFELESGSKAFTDFDVSSEQSLKVESSLQTENIHQIKSLTGNDDNEDKNEPLEQSKKLKLGGSLKSKLKMATSHLKFGKNKALPMLTSADEEIYKTDVIDSELDVCDEKDNKTDLVLSNVNKKENTSKDSKQMDLTVAKGSGTISPEASSERNVEKEEENSKIFSKDSHNMPDEKVNVQSSTLEKDIKNKEENRLNNEKEKSKLKENESEKLCADLKFSREFHQAVLEKAGAIDSNGNLLKVSTYSVGLVLAAKSVGRFGDQDIMKWIRKGKKVNAALAQEWKTMGKTLTKIFVEQFKKYSEMSQYLLNNVETEDVKTWQSILAENEYIWPIGLNKGWLNIFTEIPNLCSKIDTICDSSDRIKQKSVNTEAIPTKVTSEVHTLRKDEKETLNNQEVIERKLKDEDNDSKDKKLKSVNPTDLLDSTKVEVKIEKEKEESEKHTNISDNNSSPNKKECVEKINPSNLTRESKSSLNANNQEKEENSIKRSKIFCNDYFINQLREANAINSESDEEAGEKVLLKVTNITVGLVMAAIATGWYSDVDIIKWIRRGRKLNSQIKEQFTLFKKLSIYLVSNDVDQEQEWKKILGETKYVWPSKENDAWTNIFGFIPTVSNKISVDLFTDINATCDISKKEISPEPESTKSNDIVEENSEVLISKNEKGNVSDESVQETKDLSNSSGTDEKSDLKSNDSENVAVPTRFSKEYHKSFLEEAGAIDSNGNLLKISNYSVALVLSAKSLGTIGDQDIMKWIRKGKKVDATLAAEWKKMGKTLTKIFVEQFKKYSEMSQYLMNDVKIEDVKKWTKILCENEYIWPIGLNKGWLNVFKETPECCQQIDATFCDGSQKEEENKIKDSTSSAAPEMSQEPASVMDSNMQETIKPESSIKISDNLETKKSLSETEVTETNKAGNLSTIKSKAKPLEDSSDASKVITVNQNQESTKSFTKEYHQALLEKEGAIDSTGSLLKVSKYSVALVLAAKSLGTIGDQDIMKWIRKGKKVDAALATEWKKMGKAMTKIFVEQFKKYSEMSQYLMNNVKDEDIKVWSKILSENEYIWPVGQSKGWLNVFKEMPDLCSMIDAALCETNMSKQQDIGETKTSSCENIELIEKVKETKELTPTSAKEIESLEKGKSSVGEVTKIGVSTEVTSAVKDQTAKKCEQVKDLVDENKTIKATTPDDVFTIAYFLSKLEDAGAIKDKTSKDLVKVVNISVGLVLSAISTGRFAYIDIIKWIRKGRKLNDLLENQFDTYKQLSVYLMKDTSKANVKEWEELLDSAKYVWPDKDNVGWEIIFGEIPEICQTLNFDNLVAMPENLSINELQKSDLTKNSINVNEVGTETKVKDMKNDEAIICSESEKPHLEIPTPREKVKFSKEYFMSILEKVGASQGLKDAPSDENTLIKISNITIGHVVATKAVGSYKDQDIMKWIKKGSKIDADLSQKYKKMGKALPALFVEQFKKYKQLSSYLLCKAEEQDIDKWLELLDKPFVWAQEMNSDWKIVFGEVPELCKKVDSEKDSSLNREVESTTQDDVKSKEEKSVSDSGIENSSKLNIGKPDLSNNKSKETDFQKSSGKIKEDESKTLSRDEISWEEKNESTNKEIKDLPVKNTSTSQNKRDSSIIKEVGVTDEGPPTKRIKKMSESSESKDKAIECTKDTISEQKIMGSEAKGIEFSMEYFMSILLKAGAVESIVEEKTSERTLVKVKDVTIMHVLAAKTAGLFKDQDIMKWIKKGCKIDPQIASKYKKMGKELPLLFVEQFKKYKQLSVYLMNSVEEQDKEKWIELLNKSFVWPEDITAGWINVFGNVPDLTKKVDGYKGADNAEAKKEVSERRVLSSAAPCTTKENKSVIKASSNNTEGKQKDKLEHSEVCDKSVDDKVVKSDTMAESKSSVQKEESTVSKEKLIIDKSDEKMDDASISKEPIESEVIFSQKYSLHQLIKAGALKKMAIMEKCPKNLVRITNITVGLVLAAKSSGFFNDQDLMKWIRKGKKIDSEIAQKWKQMGSKLANLFVEQFKKYKELSDYLMNRVDPSDVESWVQLLDSYMYSWPTETDKDWSYVFGLKVPELCNKIHSLKEKSEISETIESNTTAAKSEPVLGEYGSLIKSNKDQKSQSEKITSDSDAKASTKARFDKEYFISQLKDANAIKSANEKSLLPVKKVSVGLLIAARSINMYTDQEVMKWVKKTKHVDEQLTQKWKTMGKALSALFLEQFKKMKILSEFLQNEVDPTDIATWKNILNNEYIWPVGEGNGWGNVFSEIPVLCSKIDKAMKGRHSDTASTGNVAKSAEEKVSLKKPEKIEAKDKKTDISLSSVEKLKENESIKLPKKPTITKIDKNYFISELRKAGAIVTSQENKNILTFIPKISVGLVLSAIAIREFSDTDILRWIKTGEKMSPLLEEQFIMYKQFALYLVKLNDTVEIEEWHMLLQRTEYVWPVGRRRSWVNIFGELSGPCKKINVNQIYSIIDDTAIKSKDTGLKEKPKNLTRLNKNYFMGLMTSAGALKTEQVTMSYTKKTLITISTSKLTVGVVVGAFVIGQMQGQIKQWLKKCMFSYNIDKRPGVNQQMSLYSKLGTYLQHDVPLDDVQEWKELLTANYIPPSVDEYVWTNVFEKEPILCENIDISSLISAKKPKETAEVKPKDIPTPTNAQPSQSTAYNTITKAPTSYTGSSQTAHYSAPPTPYVDGKNQSTTVQTASYAANQQQAVPQGASYYNTGYGNQALAQGQAAATYGAHTQAPGMHNIAVGAQQTQTPGGAYGTNYYQYYGGQYMQGQGTMGQLPYNAQGQGQTTMPGTYGGVQDQSANYAQMYPGYGTQYMMPGGTSQTVETNASTAKASTTTVAEDENEKKKKIFFYDFPKELTDGQLKLILNEIGEVEEFSRNEDARDFCTIKMKDVNRVFRMFRILNGLKAGTSDLTWKVNVLHAPLFTKKEKTYGSNKSVENKIREQIKSIIDPILAAKNIEKEKVPVVPVKSSEPSQALLDRIRKNRSRSRSRSPGKRKRRSKSRSPDKRRRSKSPRSRFPDRRRSKSPRRRKSKSRSPKRKLSPDRNRRKRSRSRSRSPDRGLRRSPISSTYSEDKCSVEVFNLSISLNKSMLNPVLDQCGGRKMKRPTGLILPDTNCVTEFIFNTPWSASIIAKLINGFRIPDRHLKVKLKIDEDVGGITKDREEFTWKRLEQSLSVNQDIFVCNVQTQIRRKGVYDIFGYKTRPCVTANCSPGNRNCEDYHNVYEQRRDMRLFSYTDEECPYSKRGNCPEGEDCDKAHSNVERAYHMCRIHRDICPYDGPVEKCPRNYCIYAHAETPEVLYSNSWRDVHTSGLGQTFEYLVGAIHNLRHIDIARQGVYILLITPSKYMCHWLAEAVRELCKDYRQRIAIVNDKFPTDGEKIIFGTPESVINLLQTGAVEVVGTLAAVILDDSSLLLSSYLQEMKTIAHSLTTGQRYTQIDLNCVVVSDQNYEDEVDTWSDLLNTEFIVLGSLSPGLAPEQIQSPIDMKNKGKIGEGAMSSRHHTPISAVSQKEGSTSRSMSRSSIPHEEKSNSATDSQRARSSSRVRPSKTPNPASYKTINACNKLIALCDRMGFIGHSLKAIIQKAIEHDNDNDKVLKVFMEPDSIMVMDMAMSKLCKDASLATDPSSKEELLQAFSQTKALIEFLKNPAAAEADEPKEKEPDKPYYGLNIDELATVTYNKDPTILFKLIKDYLSGVGVEPTDDKVKEVFNVVTTIHFKMGSKHIPDDDPVEVSKPPSRSDIPPKAPEPQSSGQMGLSELLAVGDDMDASYNAGDYNQSRDRYDSRLGPDRGGPPRDDYRYGQINRGMPSSDDYRGSWDGGRQGPEWDRYGRAGRDRSPGLDRSAASDYNRPAAPDYNRPAASGYNMPDAPGLHSRFPRGPSGSSTEWNQPGDYRYSR